MLSKVTLTSGVQQKGCDLGVLSSSPQALALGGGECQSILSASWVQQKAGTSPLGGSAGSGWCLETSTCLEPAETQRLRNHQFYIIEVWCKRDNRIAVH